MEKILLKDLDGKAVVIQRLMTEANDHASTLAKHAELISSLTTSNKAFQAEVDVLREAIKNTRQMGTTRIEDMRKRQQEAAVAIQAAKSTEQKQLAQIKGIMAAIVEEQLKQKDALRKAAKLKQEVEQFVVRPGRRHWAERSERAIRVQQLFIERLTKENESIPGLQQRVQRMERVIAKLEKRLYSCGQQELAVAAAGQGQDINPRTKYRIRDLQQQILDATDRQTALHRVLSGEDDGKPIPMGETKEKWAEDEKDKAAPVGGGAPSPSPSVKGAKDARIQALQEQLVANAKEFAAQISKLKLDIMQAEMGGGGEGDSDDDEDEEDSD